MAAANAVAGTTRNRSRPNLWTNCRASTVVHRQRRRQLRSSPEATTLDATNDERTGTVDTFGTRLGILCVALGLSMSACAGPEAETPDLRTPPARETPSVTLGELAGQGADGTSP